MLAYAVYRHGQATAVSDKCGVLNGRGASNINWEFVGFDGDVIEFSVP